MGSQAQQVQAIAAAAHVAARHEHFAVTCLADAARAAAVCLAAGPDAGCKKTSDAALLWNYNSWGNRYDSRCTIYDIGCSWSHVQLLTHE